MKIWLWWSCKHWRGSEGRSWCNWNRWPNQRCWSRHAYLTKCIPFWIDESLNRNRIKKVDDDDWGKDSYRKRSSPKWVGVKGVSSCGISSIAINLGGRISPLGPNYISGGWLCDMGDSMDIEFCGMTKVGTTSGCLTSRFRCARKEETCLDQFVIEKF